MTSSCDALVVGAGGFVGGHLVRSLLLQGLTVRAVDVSPVPAWSTCHPAADNRSVDVSGVEAALAVTSGATTVYDLVSADRGGHRSDRMSAVLLDTHLLVAARDTGVDRFVLASSAVDVPAPRVATAADDRRWRHLFTERMARHFHEDLGVQTRVARLGPVYGPHASRTDDAAAVTVVTRLVADAAAGRRTAVDIPFRPGDRVAGVYVDDAVLGLQLVAHGVDDARPYDVVDPDPPTAAEVVAAVLAASGASLHVRWTGTGDTAGPVGDHRPLLAAVDWAPDIALTTVVPAVYAWTSADVLARRDLPTDLTARWARRRALTVPRGSATSAGRHRYENTG